MSDHGGHALLTITSDTFPCFSACVKVGSRVWARAEKGCFLRGVVTAMDDEIHVQLENGKKIRHKKEHPESVVADAIPHVMEVEIGTRVLAKWCNRLDTYYPGTVTAVRRSFFDVRFDDGDKGINELRELRILKKREPEDGKLAIHSSLSPSQPLFVSSRKASTRRSVA